MGLKDCFHFRSPSEEFDTLAHDWLDEWMNLTSILQAIFKNYFALATQTPSLVIECLKIVEIHENIAEHYNQESQSEDQKLLHCSMMPVLLQAASVYREPRTLIDGKLFQVQDNLVDLCITTIRKSVEARVKDVSYQAFYKEDSCDTRNLVLDALVEDLYAHQEDINALFPRRYNMNSTVCTFYSEYFAKRLKELMSQIERGAAVQASSNQAADSAPVNFSNADVLSLIKWVERFITATLKISFDNLNTSHQVSETLNGELLHQLDAFRRVYVQRTCAKLREWMQSILEKEKASLMEVSLEQATDRQTPLLSAAPIDVFSAVQSELHTMLEEVSDPTLAAWSACAMGEVILEHAEGYEKVVEGFDSIQGATSKHQKAKSSPLRRMNSSPAAFVKTIHARTASNTSISNNAPGIAPVEIYCIAANNCFVYHEEASEVIRLMQRKLEVWDLASPGKFVSKSLDRAKGSIKRFKDLVRSSIIRFQHSCTLAIKCLVKSILGDIRETLLGVSQDSWLREECQCMDTVCATFHDYCMDISRYLQPDVYTQFLLVLFEDFREIYLSGA